MSSLFLPMFHSALEISSLRKLKQGGDLLSAQQFLEISFSLIFVSYLSAVTGDYQFLAACSQTNPRQWVQTMERSINIKGSGRK